MRVFFVGIFAAFFEVMKRLFVSGVRKIEKSDSVIDVLLFQFGEVFSMVEIHQCAESFFFFVMVHLLPKKTIDMVDILH